MPLLFEDGSAFASGRTTYSSLPCWPKDKPRLQLPIKLNGLATLAVLDTGGLYLICNPEICEELGLGSDGSEPAKIKIQGIMVTGKLERIEVQISAEKGQTLQFQATAFVPVDSPISDLPTFLGWHCCIERLRFAVDPQSEQFYFGPCQGD